MAQITDLTALNRLNIDDQLVARNRTSGLDGRVAAAMIPEMVSGILAANRIVSLVTGNDDEATSSVSNCTVEVDTTNFKIGDRGLGVTISSATTASVIYDPVSVIGDPFIVPPASAVAAWVYVTDASKITSIEIDIYKNAGLTSPWVRTSSHWGTLVNGWNLMRWAAVAGDITNWGSIYRIRILITASSATTVTIGHLFLECPRKAQLMFIEDGGYVTFMNNGYPDLKDRGIPCTWSIDPGNLGTGTGINVYISEADVATLANDGNGNSIGFHAWDSTLTSTMTESELRSETMKCLKWLKSRGYSGGMWRSAFLQNLATNHAAIQPLLLAYATHNGGSSLSCWPFVNRFNVPRIGLHGLSQAQMDTHFSNMQVTNCLMVCYTHMIDSGGGTNITQENWDYFLAKVDAARSAGWLECVTFEQLFAASGGRVVLSGGDAIYEYFDDTGVRTQKRLP